MAKKPRRTTLHELITILFSCPALLFCQQTFTTTGPCSPIAPYNQGVIKIQCNVASGKEGEQLIAILNQIKGNQLDLKLVKDKLDEFSRTVKNLNPKLPVITYMYDGDQRVTRPGFITDNPDNPASRAFVKIKRAYDNRDWQTLLSLCDESINETPDWLTPYLYRASAYANLGRAREAVVELDSLKERVNRNPDYDLLIKQCDELLEKLHGAGY